MNMDWVHCNRCAAKYNQDLKYLLTECGHIFCVNCVPNTSETRCILCQKTSKCMEVSKDMESHVQPFFTPFESLLKKCTQVYTFQMMHRDILLHIQSQKYAYAKKAFFSLQQKNKMLIQELKMAKHMLSTNGRMNNPSFMTSTPSYANNISQLDNTSMVSSIPPLVPKMMENTSSNGRPSNLMRGYPNYAQHKMLNPHNMIHGHQQQQQGISPVQMVPENVMGRYKVPPSRGYGRQQLGGAMQQFQDNGKRT